MTGLHAEILIGIHLVTLTNDESPEWPVALANPKFHAARIIELFQRADDNFLHRRVGQFARSVLV